MKSELAAAGPDVCHVGVDRLFYTLCFGKERCKLFLKNLHWLQRRGEEKGNMGGSSRIGTQSLRKKYFLLLIGYGQPA